MPASSTAQALGSAPKGPGPWSPTSLAAISFFLSFLPAGIMYAINYERLGQPKKKLPAMIIAIVAFLIFIIGAAATPDTGFAPHIFQAVHVAVVAFFARSPQAKLFAEHIRNGGTRGTLMKPILISISVLALAVGAVVGYAFLEANGTQAQYDAGFELLNKGELAQAEALFLRMREEQPEDVDPYWGLSNVYVRMERYDEARTELKKTLELAPDLQPAIELRDEIKALEAEGAKPESL